MKAIVNDVKILKSINPCQLEHYLQNNGWRERTCVPNRVSGWTRDSFAEDKLKIYLPLDQSFDDYPRRMYEIIETLEKAENRSQLDIISELITNYPSITIQGTVTELQTPNNDKLSGKVILLGILVDKLQKITTELTDKDYILALKAYQERAPIYCTGDLIKENETFILNNPRNFVLVHL
ncbi:hypothetical protein RIVM261_063930 [Rivularia sp. IAM M-261]|nr:hypothetical protein RIVM261_063930 [Rivularia sp. IAM M-261]